ncbi:MAG: hypothetical protein KIT84_25060 [Labilithrix sp.]|nr:hypothetical protein [Labilithrix sp.]MCW5814321.1 hypothetical protein [Labilithrix sp.]
MTLVRHVVASILGVAAAAALFLSIRAAEWYILSLPLGLLLSSSVLIHRPSLGPQVLARAIWWANLALGAVLATAGSNRERMAGGLLALACGAALLVAGRRALGETNARGAAVPAALRSMLLLLMIFALADAQTFLLFGSVGLIEESAKLGVPAIMLAIGGAYVAGFVGLYRLELWGAIVNIVVSLAVLVMLLGTRIIHKSDLVTFLAILAVVHVLVALPVVLAAVRKVELPGLPPRVRATLTNVVVVLLMVFATVSWASR